jgi:dolichyl-phosphate-mannose-protein mannosyltransferase
MTAPQGVQARAKEPILTLPRVNVSVTVFQVALAVVLIAAFLTRFVRLGEPDQFYFDETYFPRTAQEIYRGDPKAWEFYGHENTHPPLSKLFMAGGIAVFEGANEIAPSIVPGTGGVDNPWAWRFFGALAGVGAVLFMYLLSRRLFNSEIAGLAGAFLLTCEGLAFAQSRIATPDTYVLFFILGAMYFLTTNRFLPSGVFFGAAVACKWIAALAGVPIVLYLGWLLITRLRESKWDGQIKSFEVILPVGFGILYAGITAFVYSYLNTPADKTYSVTQGPMEIGAFMLIVIGGVAMLSSLIALIAERRRGGFTLTPQGKLCLEIALIFGVFFILVPGFIYFMTYWPMLLNPPSVEAMGDKDWHGLGQVIRQNRQAFDFHSHLRASHPWSSPWDTWPIMGRPIYFYADADPGVRQGWVNGKIYSMGNPLIFWAALPALAFALWQGFAYVRARLTPGGALAIWGSIPPKQAALLFVVLAYLGLWLPMSFTSRVLFLYHYLPALAFGILALAYSVDWVWHRPGWGKQAAVAFLALVALLFAFLYPHLADVSVPLWLDKLYYPFDRGNPLENPLLQWE